MVAKKQQQQEKIEIKAGGLSQAEADEFKKFVSDLVKKAGGKINIEQIKTCDFCGKIIPDGEKYIHIDEHNDMCLNCSKAKKKW